MRHGKKVNHLSRQKAHREALLSNLATSLILSKRISTTVAKAKALRKYVEPLITKAKDDTTHSRRTVMSYLQNKEGVRALFAEVAGRVGTRPGGYTRIIKMGDVRLGDNADMCLMELVDFNDIYKKDGAEKKGKTRRSRSKGKKEDESVEAADTAAPEKKKEEKPKAEKSAKPAKKKSK
jgi:large subunit ribosomal protein L17